MSSVDLPDRVLRKKKELEIDRLFQALVKLAGSDLHLKVDRPPYVRVKGALRTLNRGPIDDEEMNRLIFPMMDERNRKIYNGMIKTYFYQFMGPKPPKGDRKDV